MKFVKFVSIALVMMLLCVSAVAEGTFTVATNAEFAPWEYVDDDGSFAGIDMDIAAIIAEKLGSELVVENMAFGACIPALVSGKVDAVIAGLTIGVERGEAILYSDPYVTATQVIIVNADNEEIKGVADLVGKKIGVQESTTGDFYATEIEDAQVERFASGTNAAMDLAAGRLDAVIIDIQPAYSIAAAVEGLKVLDEEKLTEEYYGMAFAPDNTELAEKVNAILTELIADGTIDEILVKYSTAPEEPVAAE